MEKFISSIILICIYLVDANFLVRIPFICFGLAWFLFVITLFNDITTHLVVRQQILDELNENFRDDQQK